MFIRLYSFFTLFVCLLLTACNARQAPAPVIYYGGSSGAGSAGVHAVQRGDTLYSLSKRYKTAMRDIVFANHLSAPFTLSVGQRLILPPPQDYRVRQGDNLYAIARLFEVSVNQLASLNHIAPPYIVQAGQVLTLPSRAPTTQSAYSKGYVQQKFKVSNGKAIPPPAVEARQLEPQQQQQDRDQEIASVPAQKPNLKTARVPVRKAKITTKTPARSGSGKFLQPVRGNVISSYGAKTGGLHNDGINIAAPRGAPVAAAENGVVVYVGNELKGSGNLVLVRHADRWMSAYAHLDKTSVMRGQTIKRGAKLGTVGSTGSVSTPQLHFELRRGTQAINPKLYL